MFDSFCVCQYPRSTRGRCKRVPKHPMAVCTCRPLRSDPRGIASDVDNKRMPTDYREHSIPLTEVSHAMKKVCPLVGATKPNGVLHMPLNRRKPICYMECGMIERSFLRAMLANRNRYHYELWRDERPPFAEENPLDERRMHERSVLNCCAVAVSVWRPPTKSVVQNEVQTPQCVGISMDTN